MAKTIVHLLARIFCGPSGAGFRSGAPQPTACEAVKKLDFVFLALVFSVTYRREKPDFSIFSQLLAPWAKFCRPSGPVELATND